MTVKQLRDFLNELNLDDFQEGISVASGVDDGNHEYITVDNLDNVRICDSIREGKLPFLVIETEYASILRDEKLAREGAKHDSQRND